MEKAKKKAHLDTPVNSSRKIKKIQLEVWEDSEASFYMALANLKDSKTINPDDVTSLLDSIYYPVTSSDQQDLILNQELRLSWQYIHQADKFSKGNFARVSDKSFSLFIESEFGQSLLAVYYHCKNLQAAANESDDLRLKTDLSFFSFFIEGFKNTRLPKPEPQTVDKIILHSEGNTPGKSLELTPDGIITITDEIHGIHQAEIFVQKENGLHKVFTLEELGEASQLEVIYMHIQNNPLMKLEKVENDYKVSFLINASISNGVLDLSDLKEMVTYGLLSEVIPSIKNDTEAPFISIEKVAKTHFQVDLNTRIPVKINKELEKQYAFPENAKKSSYARYQIVNNIYQEIDKWFPDLSVHIKSTIAGYLCIPLGIVDSEEKHDNSPRTGSYHAYVGKTIRNILKGKS